MDEFIEMIKCPNCGKIQEAKVIADVPFYVYIHECTECKYLIEESEWEKVEENE